MPVKAEKACPGPSPTMFQRQGWFAEVQRRVGDPGVLDSGSAC